MSMVESKLNCLECGMKLEDDSSVTFNKRKPCPNCGSLKRAFGVDVYETLELHEKTRIKHKKPGNKHPFTDLTFGDDYNSDTQRWNTIKRFFDWVHDWYDEIIRDKETGAVTHECHEPLSQHVGHGDAKYKKNK